MKALVFNEKKLLQLNEVDNPKIMHDTDALIRIKATGICGTDIHILKKDYPAKKGVILGHESSGIVEKVGSRVTNVKVGERVILDPTYHCGVCYYCQNNRPNYCAEKHHTETGVSSDGTFAKYHVADSSFLFPLPKNMTFEEGTLAEPLACALNALRQSRIAPESRILVIGAGPLGLLFGLATQSMGCETIVGDLDEYRVKNARKIFSSVQNYKEKDILLTNAKNKFDIIVDTSGKCFDQTLKLIDRGGDILVIGLDYNFESKLKPSYLTDNGIRIIGSIDSNNTFAPAIKMISKNKKFGEIITHTFPIKEYEKAFDCLGLDLNTSTRKEINGNKVVICPS